MYLADAPVARQQPQVGGGAMVAVADTARIPFRWICRIRVQAERGHSYGTGFLVSPWHVVTAAHSIYFRQEPDSWRTIEVGPGFGPSSKTAIKSNGWAVDPLWSVRDCMTDGSDVGLIRLAQPVSRAIGFAPLAPLAPGALMGRACFLAGYPSRPDDVDATQMFRSSGQIRGGITIQSCTPNSAQGRLLPAIAPPALLIAHDADSVEAMSGGPLWVMERETPLIVGVHTGTMANGAVKKAVLLSDRIQAQIQGWMNGALRPL